MQDIQNHIEQMINLHKRSLGHLNCCLEGFVQKFGQEFVASPRPKRYTQGLPRHCYMNSAKLAMRSTKLVYVEGLASIKTIGLVIPHAWVVELNSNRVIDVTSDGFKSYFGVAFKTHYVREVWDSRKSEFSLLNNWQQNHPLLNMDFEQVLTLTEKIVSKSLL